MHRFCQSRENILPLLEDSSGLLQDESSWYDAHEELVKLLPFD